METTKTENNKQSLSLTALIAFMVGGYTLGDNFGEKCVSYMNFTGGKALAIWIACAVRFYRSFNWIIN